MTKNREKMDSTINDLEEKGLINEYYNEKDNQDDTIPYVNISHLKVYSR